MIDMVKKAQHPSMHLDVYMHAFGRCINADAVSRNKEASRGVQYTLVAHDPSWTSRHQTKGGRWQ